MPKKVETVKVAIRCRPLNSKEKNNGNTRIVNVNNERGEVCVSKPSDMDAKPKTFTFDFSYGPDSTQKQVYDQCASQIVKSCLEGYNGTIFAYGQTGTGKTFTMEGNRNSETDKGVIPRAFEHVNSLI